MWRLKTKMRAEWWGNRTIQDEQERQTKSNKYCSPNPKLFKVYHNLRSIYNFHIHHRLITFHVEENPAAFHHTSPPIGTERARQAWWCPRVTAAGMQGHLGCDVINMCRAQRCSSSSVTRWQPAAERIRTNPRGHAVHVWTNLGRRSGWRGWHCHAEGLRCQPCAF